MVSGNSRRLGSAACPNRGLRAKIVTVLAKHDGLTAWEIAANVYQRRLIVRRSWYRTATEAQLGATRRALRRLVKKGRVIVIGRDRRKKVYALPNRIRSLPISLGEFD
jgi:hypothetical protein